MQRYVVALRHFDEPRDVGEVSELTYLALDRRSMLSVYESTDLEAIREAQTLPYTRMFTAGTWREMLGLGPPAPVGARSLVIMERYHDPASVQELLERARREYAPCFNANNIDLMDSYMPVPNDDTSVGGVCVYAGPDADTLRRANRTVGFDFERAWPATVINPLA